MAESPTAHDLLVTAFWGANTSNAATLATRAIVAIGGMTLDQVAVLLRDAGWNAEASHTFTDMGGATGAALADGWSNDADVENGLWIAAKEPDAGS
jgi:hypothetical protein